MATFNDFAVDPCVAAQIKACLLVKACLLEKLRPINRRVQKQIGPSGKSASINSTLRITLNDVYTCLVEELQRAYEAAGEIANFPVLPPFPTAIDFQTSADVAAPVNVRVTSDPLEFLSSVMTIETDSTGTPTFIRCV